MAFFEDMKVLDCDQSYAHMVAIVQGDPHSKVYGWGQNKNNKLSDKILEDIAPKPTELEFFSKLRAKSVVCGSYHTILTTETVDLD